MKGPVDDLESALAERRILVVCGSGGVGKTTTAAALALRAALGGRRVLVCTIDPSRRLATSLGLARLPGRPRELDLGKLRTKRTASLWAMTLDTKSTFDSLVERYAGDEAARQRILENRFYRQVSAALSGSHEYMAMEKLLDLSQDDRFDLVVLDTPPTRHALDFLEAPDRMLGFLDASVLRWFLKPYFVAGRLTLKIATRTGAMAFRLADRYLGLQFLQDLSEFFLAFEGMYDGFKERAGKVHALLRDPSSGFVLVASPARQALEEAFFFFRRLREKEMPFVSFLVNRVHPRPASTRGPLGPLPDLDPDFVTRLVQVHHDYKTLAHIEERHIARLEVDSGRAAILVPEFEADVHDLRGLRDIGAAIFDAGVAASRGPAGAAAGAKRSGA